VGGEVEEEEDERCCVCPCPCGGVPRPAAELRRERAIVESGGGKTRSWDAEIRAHGREEATCRWDG
jgi:hypothetical protein